MLTATLCRIFLQDGYRVAPFKAQNMALNSGVTALGEEMGRAQIVQAQACRIDPDARMNPILLKPTTDVGSQVIVNGVVQGNMHAMEYYRRKREYIHAVMEAYNSLAAENDILVIEGAGSPAEINLKQEDIVNMGLAKLVDAPVLLVGDIDRGGVFAQLFGTVALLEPDERARIRGTIVNNFRGDKKILEPGLKTLEELCGVPVAGVLTSAAVTVVAVVVVFLWPQFAFNYLMSIATIAAIINWTMIMITEMLFRRRVAAGDGPGELNGLRGAEALAKIRFKLPGWNWTPYVIIAFLAMVAVLRCFSPSYRIALIAGVIWLAVLFAAYAITSRASAKRDAKTVLDSTRK